MFFFITDLHGKKDRYEKLFSLVKKEKPDGLFIGGDILPHLAGFHGNEEFIGDYLIPLFHRLRDALQEIYPDVFIILGNDDSKVYEEDLISGESLGLWRYVHNRRVDFPSFKVYGYACIPPTPFRLKDWECYDVSRYVDPGCTHPSEGVRTMEPDRDIEFATIEKDLSDLTGQEDLSNAIFLFHTPPYDTSLDRAALDGMMIDHIPLDVHVGSIAVKRFIEERSPAVTLHGHIHESSRLTGKWHQQIGSTYAFNAAVDSDELSVIKFNLWNPGSAERILI